MGAAVGAVRLYLHRRTDGISIPRISGTHLLRSRLAEGVFYEPALQLLFKRFRLFLAGQQRNGLDIDEPCSHFQEIACDLHILLRHIRNIVQILLHKYHYGDIVNIQLMLCYQVQKQVKRPLKDLQLE